MNAFDTITLLTVPKHHGLACQILVKIILTHFMSPIMQIFYTINPSFLKNSLFSRCVVSLAAASNKPSFVKCIPGGLWLLGIDND